VVEWNLTDKAGRRRRLLGGKKEMSTHDNKHPNRVIKEPNVMGAKLGSKELLRRDQKLGEKSRHKKHPSGKA